MKGILGRKLGMTQIFDPETGSVTAVTVIEAGPCPVTHVRSEAADGYTAVQLAYEPVLDRKITKGELKVLQMDVQTYFFRRTNMNAAGKPRSWTDHLLWHHAAHTVDLFQYQAGETVSDCYAVQGPVHPQLGIAMDMGIVMKTPSGAICNLSLSFNNDGPIGSFFRYICDNGTYNAYYDDLVDGKKNPIDLTKVDVSMDGIELEDREFIAAIKAKREPNSSLAQVLPAMKVLGRLEQIVDPQRRAHA